MYYEEEIMCPHNEFDIVYYHQGIVIRKCKSCGQIEVDTEWWVDIDTLAEALREADNVSDDQQ